MRSIRKVLADNLHSTGLCCRNILVVIYKAVNEVVEKFDFVNTAAAFSAFKKLTGVTL